MSDVRNNVFLNCNFAKLLKYKITNFWTTFLQLGVSFQTKTGIGLYNTATGGKGFIHDQYGNDCAIKNNIKCIKYKEF